MIELYQDPKRKNGCYFIDTNKNKVSTITGHGLKKLVTNLKSGDYAWFDVSTSNSIPTDYVIVSSGETIKDILVNDFPEVLV